MKQVIGNILVGKVSVTCTCTLCIGFEGNGGVKRRKQGLNDNTIYCILSFNPCYMYLPFYTTIAFKSTSFLRENVFIIVCNLMYIVLNANPAVPIEYPSVQQNKFLPFKERITFIKVQNVLPHTKIRLR